MINLLEDVAVQILRMQRTPNIIEEKLYLSEEFPPPMVEFSVLIQKTLYKVEC